METVGEMVVSLDFEKEIVEKKSSSNLITSANEGEELKGFDLKTIVFLTSFLDPIKLDVFEAFQTRI